MTTKARCKYYCRGCASKTRDGFCDALVDNDSYERHCPFYKTRQEVLEDLYNCFQHVNFKTFESYLKYLDERCNTNKFTDLLNVRSE